MDDLAQYYALSVHQYRSGLIRSYCNRMDPATRRYVPDLLFTMEQPPDKPFTPAQLLCMAAAENLVREEPLPLELPF